MRWAVVVGDTSLGATREGGRSPTRDVWRAEGDASEETHVDRAACFSKTYLLYVGLFVL